MLQLKSITKRFSEHPVVREVSFSVEEGEIFTLSGESGCGKSTLLRIIAGLEQPDTGELYFNNQAIGHIAAEKRNFGLVFQNLSLFPHLNVQQNILFGVPRKQKKNTNVESLLELTGMQGMQQRYPHQLSGGQQQRVAIARSLAIKPKLLLLDEPFSGLDEIVKSKIRAEIFALLRSLQITTILVSHESDDSFMVADRVAVMQAGVIKQIGSPKEIYEKPVDAYVASYFGPTFTIVVEPKNGQLHTAFGRLPNTANLPPKAHSMMARPEYVRISHEKISDMQAVIEHKIHKGPHDLLRLSAPDRSAVVHLETEHCPYKEGDMIFFDIPVAHQRFF